MHALNEEIEHFFEFWYDKWEADWKDHYHVNNIYSYEKKHLQCIDIEDSICFHHKVAYKSFK